MLDNIILTGAHGQKKIFHFSKDEEQMDFIEIEENTEWQLQFLSPPKARLYIDGLDLLDDERIQEDEHGLYIIPSSKPYVIYNHENNDKKYLPGIYRLKLVLNNNKFFSWLKIISKFISEDELVLMRQDVENAVKGLSRMFQSNINGSLSNYSPTLSFEQLQALSILHEQSVKFNLNCFFISSNPRYSIGSYYHWTRDMKYPLDNNSVIKMSKRKEHDVIYNKDYKITMNSPENKALKNNILNIFRIVQEIEDGLKKIENIKSTSDIRKDLILIRKYKSQLSFLINKTWLKNVSGENDNTSINNAYLDSKYLFFRKLSWKLTHISNFKPQFDRQYQYYWRRTDLLYEIWGFLEVIKALCKLKFTPQSGWIFDGRNLEFQPLKPGTCVWFVGNLASGRKVNLKVKYDDAITALNATETSQEQPLWHGASHNRPDIRVEIYDASMIFQNVIVLDTKYRRLRDIYKFSKSGSLNQLTSYRDQLFSPYPFKDAKYAGCKQVVTLGNRPSAVLNVGVLFPGKVVTNADTIKKYNDIEPIPTFPSRKDKNALLDFLRLNLELQDERFNKLSKILKLIGRNE